MNAGFMACALALAVFLVAGIAFALLKEKGAMLVSGFNTLTERERAQYDAAALSKDMRNSCFLWALIMAAGCVLSLFITPYMAIIAYAAWLVLFLKDVRGDASKAFEKYRVTSEMRPKR